MKKLISRLALKFSIDLLLWTAATPLAFVFRLEEGAANYRTDIWLAVLLVLPINAVLIYSLGLYRRSWHRLSIRDLATLVFSISIGTLAALGLALAGPLGLTMPRSVPIIAAMVSVLAMGSARVLTRMIFERPRSMRRGKHEKDRRTLVVGAGEAGIMMAREMLRHPESHCVPVGFLDDDVLKRPLRFVGLRVLGTIDDLPEIASRLEVDDVLIAIPSASGDVVRRVVTLAREAGVDHRMMPGIYDLLSGKISISQVREVALEDLLRREPVRLDTSDIAGYIRDKVVLITGAGGSIGSEIVRQVAEFGPARVVLLGRGENSIFGIDRELARTHPDLPRVPVITDIRDRDSLRRVFERHQPDVVFHAAAHKHVPLMEANPEQAVFNNVMGTRNLAELALETGVTRFVNVSTDKAVNPTSVMGASKRVAELIVHNASLLCGEGRAFVSVRFGNVLGSRGSVIPTFKEQIGRGGPITITHPDMQRYFMTIPEASQLVIQAGSMAGNGSVYVLDMGRPVKIVDLARDLIMLSGLDEEDVQIHFTGMRPGEKLFEELLTAEEGTVASHHEKIFVARKSSRHGGSLPDLLAALIAAANTKDARAIRQGFQNLVPTATLGRASTSVHVGGDGLPATALPSPRPSA